MPIDEAIRFAAGNLFRNAPVPAAGPQPVVIDPLIDGNSGVRSNATQAMGAQVAELVGRDFPSFRMQQFSAQALARAPYLFIGTFTAVDAKGGNKGDREWYRVCFALVELRTGKIVSKGFARANPAGVDHTPTAFFRDVPAWAPDPTTTGYVRTCQGTKPGDSIKAEYWDRIIASAFINDAINAYEAGRYEEALDLYRGVQRTGAGDQLRVHSGVYLSSWKLGRQQEAAQAFGQIVDYGLERKRLGVKFLFRPGSTLFPEDPRISAPYGLWLDQIAQRAAEGKRCLEISGHSSRTGPEPVNLRLSGLRAEMVRERLSGQQKDLGERLTTIGKGSSENISGLGTDDARDALDRRVEFKVTDCRPA
ncbi:MAG: OmpA family protein [Lautropia sp.]